MDTEKILTDAISFCQDLHRNHNNLIIGLWENGNVSNYIICVYIPLEVSKILVTRTIDILAIAYQINARDEIRIDSGISATFFENMYSDYAYYHEKDLIYFIDGRK